MFAPSDSGGMLSIQDSRSKTESPTRSRGVRMLPSETSAGQSAAVSVTETQPKNADAMSIILDYSDSSEKAALRERSAIMDSIEFSNSYPTNDRMKLGVCSLEVGINLVAESLGVDVAGDDYRANLNSLLKQFICSIQGVDR